MSAPTTAERVIAIVAEQMGRPVDGVKAEHDLRGDLGCDDLDMLELAEVIEADFNVTMADRDVAAYEHGTVLSLIAVVERKRGAGS